MIFRSLTDGVLYCRKNKTKSLRLLQQTPKEPDRLDELYPGLSDRVYRNSGLQASQRLVLS